MNPASGLSGAPVYFIGGTFGSGGSGWGIAITTAALTAFATLGVGYLLEAYKRHRDRCALAETFVAEISSILRLFDELRIEERYRVLQRSLVGQEAPNASEQTPADAVTFPITVYEKCADRVGTLGQSTAADVVRFYNFLSGFRTCVRIAVGPGTSAGRIQVIDYMLNSVAGERPRVEELLRKLRGIADQRLGGIETWFSARKVAEKRDS
jgi:hypothetical protein